MGFGGIHPLSSYDRAGYLVAAIVVSWCVAGAGCAGRDITRQDVRAERSTSLHFTDVTEAAGLASFRHLTGAVGNKWFPETMGSGCAFLDYDDDGRLDIALVTGGSWDRQDRIPAIRLYRNEGDGTFSERTKAAGLADFSTYGFGIAAADIDNDGDQDIFLSTLYKNLLFENEGGRFTEVGEKAGVAGASTWSTAAIFFDADRDGWLDLYVGNYVDWSPESDVWCSQTGRDKAYCTPEVYEGVPGRFYRNNGDGTFSDQTSHAGFAGVPGNNLGAAALDFNHDGWTDLAIANDLQRNLLFKNEGDGTFTEMGVRAGLAFDRNGRARAGMGVDAAEMEDGNFSVFVGNFSNEMIGAFHGLGNGLFVDRATQAQIGRPSLLTLTFGLFLFDVDLDGDLDLFTANGHVQEDAGKVQDGVAYRQPPHLFLNRSDDSYLDAAPDVGGVMHERLVARGAAFGDIDGDGDSDILVTENGGPVHLWRNDRSSTSYLRVHLEGRASNRDGIGARLTAWIDGRRMVRYVRTGSSYLSQSELAVTFGMGNRMALDSVTVEWPSGTVDRISGPVSGQVLHIEEGEGEAGSKNHV